MVRAIFAKIVSALAILLHRMSCLDICRIRYPLENSSGLFNGGIPVLLSRLLSRKLGTQCPQNRLMAPPFATDVQWEVCKTTEVYEHSRCCDCTIIADKEVMLICCES